MNLSEQYGFGWLTSLSEALQLLVVPAFGIASVAVTIYFLIGSIKFITSSGDKEKIASARNTITHAFIGLLLLVMTFILIQFISTTLGLQGFFPIYITPSK